MGGVVALGTLQLRHELAGAITLEPFVGNGGTGKCAAMEIPGSARVMVLGQQFTNGRAMIAQDFGFTADFASAVKMRCIPKLAKFAVDSKRK